MTYWDNLNAMQQGWMLPPSAATQPNITMQGPSGVSPHYNPNAPVQEASINPWTGRMNKFVEQEIARRLNPQQEQGRGGFMGALMSYMSPGGARAADYLQGRNSSHSADQARMQAFEMMKWAHAQNEPGAPNIQSYEAPGTDDKYGVVFNQQTGQFEVPKIAGAENLPQPQPKHEDVNRFVKAYEGTAQVKKYEESLPIYESMVEAQGDNDRAADLNLTYGLAKIFDPNSVVREGEQVLVRDTSSIPQWLQGEIARLNGGAALQPETRASILRQARSRVARYQQHAKQTYERYARQGERYGFPLADIETAFPELPNIDPKLFTQPPPQSAPTRDVPGPLGSHEATTAPRSTIPNVTIEQEYEALPSGSVFRSPDGKLRRKP
ncbi:MAG: hypothetical protein ACR2GC_10545 [Methyloceanibacter sp.]|uniref:hypothetical protein n=1 Tax=Methyloceanibacter sp. TaxID=1965321 RepID=UPI003D9B2C15